MPNTELGFTVQQKFPVVDIEKSNPVRVTILAHGVTSGKFVRATNMFALISGMQELNNRLFMVKNITTDTFDLFSEYGEPIDGTSYTTYIANDYSQFTLTGPALDVENLNTQEG